MKHFSLSILLLSLTVVLPVQAQTANEEFCEKFPLNSRCREESSEIDPKPLPSNNVSAKKEVVESVTLDDVENYLKELGYVNVRRNEKNQYLTFLMLGRPCSVFVSPKGTGVIISSYFPKTDKITLEALNSWNQGLRYSFAYMLTTKDDKELVFFSTDLTLIGGITEERIKASFLLHSSYQANFEKYLNEL